MNPLDPSFYKARLYPGRLTRFDSTFKYRPELLAVTAVGPLTLRACISTRNGGEEVILLLKSEGDTYIGKASGPGKRRATVTLHAMCLTHLYVARISAGPEDLPSLRYWTITHSGPGRGTYCAPTNDRSDTNFIAYHRAHLDTGAVERRAAYVKGPYCSGPARVSPALSHMIPYTAIAPVALDAIRASCHAPWGVEGPMQMCKSEWDKNPLNDAAHVMYYKTRTPEEHKHMCSAFLAS